MLRGHDCIADMPVTEVQTKSCHRGAKRTAVRFLRDVGASNGSNATATTQHLDRKAVPGTRQTRECVADKQVYA
jgi:hypothetical protein